MSLAPPPDDRACAVCGRILFLFPDDSWQHGFIDLVGEDHPPVPVKRSEIPEQLRPRCDFCSDEFPPCILPTKPFAFEATGHASTENWAACETCAKYLERNEWNAVYRRAANNHHLKYGYPPPEVQQNLRALHRLIRKNVTGAVRRIYTPDLTESQMNDAEKHAAIQLAIDTSKLGASDAEILAAIRFILRGHAIVFETEAVEIKHDEPGYSKGMRTFRPGATGYLDALRRGMQQPSSGGSSSMSAS